MKPTAWHGALVGAMLTAAFIAVSFLGWVAGSLPFLPFDLFDRISRALPGSFVTFLIDSTVAISGALGASSIGTAAKMVEQATAVGGVFLTGVAAAAILFALWRLISEPALLPGAILGAILGGVAIVVEQQLNRITSVLDGAWVFATVFVWGLAFGWSYDRLSGAASATDRQAVLVGDAGRRRVLLQIGVSTFLTTLITSVAGLLFDVRGDSLGGGRWSDTHPLPNADAPLAPLAGTRAELTPLDRHYRVDTNTRAPRIDAAAWRLKIGGLVQSPLALRLDDLREYEPLHQFATLSCISNPPGGDLISTTRWTGVSLKRLLPEMILNAAANHLQITSADGFSESLAIAAIRSDARIMLAYAWDGVPLPAEHGFPLRLFVPDLYGMKQPKWIVAIDAVDRWRPGYWVARGWDRDGRVAIASAIDIANPVSGVNGQPAVELGGVAFAGSRGVSKVEVRVDDGEWQGARLREPLSEMTWVLWRARLTVVPGAHVFTVRAYDGQGRPQEAGFHTKRLEAGG